MRGNPINYVDPLGAVSFLGLVGGAFLIGGVLGGIDAAVRGCDPRSIARGVAKGGMRAATISAFIVAAPLLFPAAGKMGAIGAAASGGIAGTLFGGTTDPVEGFISAIAAATIGPGSAAATTYVGKFSYSFLSSGRNIMGKEMLGKGCP